MSVYAHRNALLHTDSASLKVYHRDQVLRPRSRAQARAQLHYYCCLFRTQNLDVVMRCVCVHVCAVNFGPGVLGMRSHGVQSEIGADLRLYVCMHVCVCVCMLNLCVPVCM